MRENVLTVLENLHAMKPIDPQECKSWLEIKTLQITRVLRWIGCVLFAALCLIALVIRLAPIDHLDRTWLLAALGTAIGSIICAVVWLILDIFSTVPTLILFREYTFRQRQHEANHDLHHVETLLLMDKGALRQAEKWLSVKIDRIRAHMSLIFGGPDKLAIFALAGMGWLIWKEFAVGEQTVTHDAMLLAVAFFGGCALGGLFQQATLRRLSYQKDLLTMALALADDGEKLTLPNTSLQAKPAEPAIA